MGPADMIDEVVGSVLGDEDEVEEALGVEEPESDGEERIHHLETPHEALHRAKHAECEARIRVASPGPPHIR